MTRTFTPISSSVIAAMLLAGCADGGSPTVGGSGKTSVLLTDAPFPYDSVTSVDVYIERIEASTDGDTTRLDGPNWVLIAEPQRTFNLLELQNGQTALLGETTIPAGQYKALRMRLDTRRSQVMARRGAMNVDWGGYAPTPTLYAFVERPLEVGDEGGSIVIDFDVGRSFLCPGVVCTNTLTFFPVFRAVNSGATGAITGEVRGQTDDGLTSIANAAVTVYRSELSFPGSPLWAAATGKTDAQGRFTIAYLVPGVYGIRIDAPRGARLVGADRPNVEVRARQQTNAGTITLAQGEPATITLAVSRAFLTVGDTGYVSATVVNEQGVVASPEITWTSSNELVLAVTPDAPARVRVAALAAGTASVTADYKGTVASATFVVSPAVSTGPVATVQVSPASLTLAVGDSAGVRAILRDADGAEVSARPVTWTSSDPSIVAIRATFGIHALLDPRRTGTATISATSEGKTGTATVVVK